MRCWYGSGFGQQCSLPTFHIQAHTYMNTHAQTNMRKETDTLSQEHRDVHKQADPDARTRGYTHRHVERKRVTFIFPGDFQASFIGNKFWELLFGFFPAIESWPLGRLPLNSTLATRVLIDFEYSASLETGRSGSLLTVHH